MYGFLIKKELWFDGKLNFFKNVSKNIVIKIFKVKLWGSFSFW